MAETVARIANPTAADLARLLSEIASPDLSEILLVDSRTGGAISSIRVVERKLTDGSAVYDLRIDVAEEPVPIRATPRTVEPRKRTDAESKALRERFLNLAARAQLASGTEEELPLVRELVAILDDGVKVTAGTAVVWRKRLATIENRARGAA